MAPLPTMRQDLPHCHCYCAVMLLPSPCLLALLPLVDCCFKKIIPHTITCWTAGQLLPCCRHCAMMVTLSSLCQIQYLLACTSLLVLSPLADCCLSIFLKYLDIIACKMARAAAMPLPLYDNVVAIALLVLFFGAVAAWLIVFPYS